jgi:hypothetical protein
MKLVNCLRRDRPVLVDVDGTPVALARGRRPFVIPADDPTSDLTVTVAGGTATVSCGPQTPMTVVDLPPPRDGVRYLVDADILLRCPHRDDLVAPGWFRRVRDDGERTRSVLVAVHDRLHPITADTPVIDIAAELAAARTGGDTAGTGD